MEAKDQVEAANKQPLNINIDINGESDETGVKNMSMDPNAADPSRVGLSKDELMKYANQPFWVRLRNILFASFWIVWFSILVIAIGYVVHSPGCARLASAANVTAPAAAAAAPSA